MQDKNMLYGICAILFSLQIQYVWIFDGRKERKMEKNGECCSKDFILLLSVPSSHTLELTVRWISINNLEV